MASKPNFCHKKPHFANLQVLKKNKSEETCICIGLTIEHLEEQKSQTRLTKLKGIL